jgi:hypothetical protein
VYCELAGPAARLTDSRRRLSHASLWLAGRLAGYAASLGTLAPFSSLDEGWIAITAL